MTTIQLLTMTDTQLWDLFDMGSAFLGRYEELHQREEMPGWWVDADAEINAIMSEIEAREMATAS